MRRKWLLLIVAVLSISIAVMFAGCGSGGEEESAAPAEEAAAGPAAAAPTGTYIGHDNDGVQEFLGIRYGEFTPFLPATDVTTTTEDEFEAKEFGANCIQPYDEVEVASQGPNAHDCLFLNVWTKDIETTGKPVIVWIHGGSYIWGGATDPLYHGKNFVKNLPEGEDCVFVTLNYRLSIMGGLDLSSLEGYTDKYKAALNLSKLDQTQALKWVSENISAFGGDPDNVTIMGHSSGGAAVQMQMADPDSNQYFNRVIENSGVQMYVATSEEMFAESSKQVLDILGVTSIDELTALTDEEISDKIAQINDEVEGIGSRVADGEIISETWWDDLRNGSAKDIDLMIGSVNGEEDWDSVDYDVAPDAEVKDAEPEYQFLKDYDEKYQGVYGRMLPFTAGVADKYIEQQKQDGQDDVMAVQSLVNDMSAGYGSLITAEAQSKNNPNTWLYYWEYAPDKDDVIAYSKDSAEVSPWNRALHSMDVNFEFGNPDGYPEQTGDPASMDMELVGQMQSAVYNFAKTGDPNNDKITEWKPFGEDENTMVVSLDKTWHCEKNYRGDLMDILKVMRPNGEE